MPRHLSCCSIALRRDYHRGYFFTAGLMSCATSRRASMRTVFLSVTLAVVLTSCGGAPEPTVPAPATPPPAATPAAPAQPPAVKAGWVVQDMRTPESAYLDEGSGYLFVSQINGAP